jgi:aromatic ring-cleaving dioxygenase
MDFPNRPVDAIEGWHAHIYYDPEKTRDDAARLRERVVEAFPDTTMGRWHDEAVGPHLVSMYQVAFRKDQFDDLVQWLAVNREGLDILVHPLTENAWNDHIIFGFWMGDKLPLNEEKLRQFADRASR